MNSFIRFSPKTALSTMLLMQSIASVLSIWRNGMDWGILILNLCSLIILLTFLRTERKENYLVNCLKKMAEEIEEGRLEYRITHIPPQADLA